MESNGRAPGTFRCAGPLTSRPVAYITVGDPESYAGPSARIVAAP